MQNKERSRKVPTVDDKNDTRLFTCLLTFIFILLFFLHQKIIVCFICIKGYNNNDLSFALFWNKKDNDFNEQVMVNI